MQGKSFCLYPSFDLDRLYGIWVEIIWYFGTLQVYWPLDADWYCGRVVGYDSETGRHHVCSLYIIFKPHRRCLIEVLIVNCKLCVFSCIDRTSWLLVVGDPIYSYIQNSM